MEEFSIRDATPADCGDILKFIIKLAVYENEPESRVKVTREQLIRDGFESEKPWFNCIVAEVKSPDANKAKIIGFALFFPTYSTWDGPTIKVDDLYIQPEYRRSGCAMRMVERIIEKALSQNCRRLQWIVLDWNEPAINMYKKMGADIQSNWKVCFLYESEMKFLVKRKAKL